jgi:deoxyribodipyrimidine photo-lyase
MNQPLSIVWFRQDLRTLDNPALTAACKADNVLPIYILDDANAGQYKMGGASRWWLHHSLKALNASLSNALNIYHGDAATVIGDLCQRFAVETVYWNRCYEPYHITQSQNIKVQLSSQGIKACSINGSLLNEPWTVFKKDGSPYKVFTPYHREASKIDRSIDILPAPTLPKGLTRDPKAILLDSLALLPLTHWDANFYKHWTPGEAGASSLLKRFLSDGINDYKDGRDRPALKAISRLSPHLHFGDISPQQIINALLTIADDQNSEHFKREIRWREFSYYLLFHFPGLPNQNLKANFDHFPWENNPAWLKRWQQGLTGYPLVDAGMRELRQTGYMHNRVRMVVASFLIKNLLVDWRLGASWFWDCLVDADLASNSASWQWVAGCGTDASPYFRVFNPIIQGEKFDPQGEYTKLYLPELKELPDKYLYRPWEAPTDVLSQANITLGETYPHPIVQIKESRERALAAYGTTKNL